MINSFDIIIFDLDDTLFDTFGQLAGSYEGLPNIKPYSDTISTLLEIKKRNVKSFLITAGDEMIQKKKIEILGIRDLFKEIFICSQQTDKEKIFSEIIKKEIDGQVEKVLIVGDRITSEIFLGNKLGCKTVQIKQGKYKDLEPNNYLEKPNYVTSSLGEILNIL